METENARISVAVRLRPFLQNEVNQGCSNTRIELNASKKAILVLDQKQQKMFEFDYVFPESTTQAGLFEALQLNSLLSKTIKGFNTTIFAYGPTGSGKTYTMEGYEYDKNLKPVIKDTEKIGLIPRITKSLFDLINSVSEGTEYTIYCTYVQIYKENVYDLLNPAQIKGNGLRMRWSKSEEFYLENLFMHPCSSYSEVMALYNSGVKNKVLAAHNANAASSRSHCILSLHIEGINSESGVVINSKLQLVDLAGSEKVSQTGNDGMALKESIEINKALFTLRQVISTLSSAKSTESSFVPYRDSKLTSLLKQSIGGNSFCLMIACISPSDGFFEDNLSTLSYATRAALINNEPTMNLDPKTKLISNLRNKLKSLESDLETSNKQIQLLSQLFTLNPQDQLTKLKEAEKLQLGPEHLQRLKTLRNNIESLPSTPKLSSARRQFDDFSGFSLSPEILSEKLFDSVKMIRELMDANKKLKDSLSEVSGQKKMLEIENSRLLNENQDVMERNDGLEVELRKWRNRKSRGVDEEAFRKEREKMVEKIERLEEELKGKVEWSGNRRATARRGKRETIVEEVEDRGGRYSGVRKHLRPLSQEYIGGEGTKQEAIETLSRILMNGARF